MNMQPVNRYPAFTVLCYKCGTVLHSHDNPVFADLDGPAFKAYYCVVCKNILTHQEDK